jgi:hypothetical protein
MGFSRCRLDQRWVCVEQVCLIKLGHLATITVVNPVNRCPTVVVPVAEVERFARKYISLFVLAKQQGRHFRKVKRELDATGIRSAMDPRRSGRRSIGGWF